MRLRFLLSGLLSGYTAVKRARRPSAYNHSPRYISQSQPALHQPITAMISILGTSLYLLRREPVTGRSDVQLPAHEPGTPLL